MKAVLIIILVLIVLVLSFLQMITRVEVTRLRRKEVAIDAQIEVLQKRVSDTQLALESGCMDVNKLNKRLEAQIETNSDVFAKVNMRIDELATKKESTPKKAPAKKKAEEQRAQQ